ncbi:MAG: biotin transporter BioY [Clostridia bacterium]
MTNLKNNTQKLVLIAICTALIIVFSQLSLPMPTGVPITLQTFAVALVAYILGAKKGTIAVLVFLCIGAIGIPVFSNFSGGFAKIFGFTGGFLYGFLPMAFVTGLSNKQNNKIIAILLGVVGLLICDSLGALQYAVIAQIDFLTSFLAVSLPYLIKDIILVVMAYVVSETVKFTLKKTSLAQS